MFHTHNSPKTRFEIRHSISLRPTFPNKRQNILEKVPMNLQTSGKSKVACFSEYSANQRNAGNVYLKALRPLPPAPCGSPDCHLGGREDNHGARKGELGVPRWCADYFFLQRHSAPHQCPPCLNNLDAVSGAVFAARVSKVCDCDHFGGAQVYR